MKNGIEGFMDERLIELNSIFEDEKQLSLLEQTPAAALGSCRKKLPDPDSVDSEEFYSKLSRSSTNSI